MKLNAYAKINLALDVINRRPDGYHEVRMIMQTLDLHDELDIERTEDDGIHIVIEPHRDDIPLNNDNLICRAARLMMDKYGLTGGIRVSLVKNIPVAAGLAGGSSDAAATIRAVNELYGLGLSLKELCDIGVRIGADVPYCLTGGTVLAEGIGEILTPLAPCPGWKVLLAKPPVDISTAQVYRDYRHDNVCHPDIDLIIEGIERGDLKTVAGNMGNVLQSVTAAKTPYIDQISEIMTEHGGYPLMSGSGPTVFAFYDNEEDMKKAYDCLRQKEFVSDLYITRIIDGRA